MAYKKDVRILLLGEDGVGKTSLILSLVSEEFPEEVPARSEEITIPADVTPEKVPTHIVDFSAQEQDEVALVEEIQRANVICVVYAVNDPSSVERIRQYWLPKVRETLGRDTEVPIILVGNKSDLVEASTMDSIIPIMNQFSEVETCVECSAKNLKNISELFYYAQKAVLHPTGPLYSTDDKDLKPACKEALSRIFRICDMDNDGILSDEELSLFQRRCFNSPLQPQALEDVKAVVKKNVGGGVADNGLTESGFIFLHILFIQRGRHETTWTVLRMFGYDDSLHLSDEHLNLQPSLLTGATVSTELSQLGYEFLEKIFKKYDKDKDGALSPEELQKLFSTCPTMPWAQDVNSTVCTNGNHWITREGYLAQWTLTTLLDTPRAMEYLACLGYRYLISEHLDQQFNLQSLPGPMVAKEKALDRRQSRAQRNVFYCNVIGPEGVGKTSLLQGLVNRNTQQQGIIDPDYLSRYTINTVTVYGQEKYLLLHEIDIDVDLSDPLEPADLDCDVACLVYDIGDARTFEHCARVYTEYFEGTDVACLMVASKSDQHPVRQVHELQPAQFCLQHKLPPPQTFSASGRITRDVYTKLATLAAYPHATGQQLQRRSSSFWLKTGITAAAFAVLGTLLYRFLKDRR